MKKLAFVLLLIIPMVAVADRRNDFVNKILEYENTQTDNNTARINAYGVNQEKVWDMMIHMSMSDLEKQINNCIRKYYKFDNSFFTPFGSVASVSLLNGMAPKHIPDFYLILNEVKY